MLTSEIIIKEYKKNKLAFERQGKYVGDCYRNLSSISKLMSIFIEYKKNTLTKSEIVSKVGSAPSIYSQHCRILIAFNLTVNEDYKDGLTLNENGEYIKECYIKYFNINNANLVIQTKKIYEFTGLPFFMQNYCIENLKNTSIEKLDILKNQIILWLYTYFLNQDNGINLRDIKDDKEKITSISNIKIFKSDIFSLNISTLKWFDTYLLDLNLIDEVEDKKRIINLKGMNILKAIFLKKRIKDKLCYQNIFYGAPGTGKSFKLNTLSKTLFRDNNIERVTFYDGYTYGQFVGTYKPIMKDENIVYDYVIGPLLRQILKAYNNPNEGFLLIIEEINRAKCDKVFGDIFQLLDRNICGQSEYPILLNKDFEQYLSKYEKKIYNECVINKKGLYLPDNLYIWATMNNSDQGIYPMDTAFKRRWNFKYIKIDENMNNFGISGKKYLIKLYIENNKIYSIEWNKFRKVINQTLLHKANIAEDRLLAPFFIKPTEFEKIEEKKYYLNLFVYESKILMYLFDDVLRHYGKDKVFLSDVKSFSELISLVEENKNIFNEDILKNMNEYIELSDE